MLFIHYMAVIYPSNIRYLCVTETSQIKPGLWGRYGIPLASLRPRGKINAAFDGISIWILPGRLRWIALERLRNQ
jgi:hypothetical protein